MSTQTSNLQHGTNMIQAWTTYTLLHG